ncbi:MAG: helix-turn-helix transcriptional regulator, partial [Paludibacteraceae bacterium]|nr:helix-turn-helix transcriptional regulator [Paludibacteraceae bacterium]
AIIGINYVYLCSAHGHTRGFTQQWFVILMLVYSTEQILYRKDPWQRLRTTAQEPEPEDANDTEQPNSAYWATLETWLEQDKPYLNPDFQLTDLRKVLPLNRTYLSQLINAEYGGNFYKWVNDLRIKEAKRLMTEQPELKIQDIAERCGFSSRRAFTRIFTRDTGTSPSEWLSAQNSQK